MCNDIDTKIKEALTKRALGYEVEEKEIIVDKNGKQTGKLVLKKRHMPPDVAAIKEIQRLMDTGRW